MTHVLFAVSVYLAEQRFFLVVGILASSNLASFIFYDVLLYQGSWLVTCRRQALSIGFYWTLLTLAALLLRRLRWRSLARARDLVLIDRRCYDAAWAELLSGKFQLTELQLISLLSAKRCCVSRALSPAAARKDWHVLFASSITGTKRQSVLLQFLACLIRLAVAGAVNQQAGEPLLR